MSGPQRLFAAQGGANGPAVVLLHGFGGTSAVWDDVLDLLDVPVATVAYDLPGHGRSLGFARRGSIAEALLADLAERGHERFHLCGHSMGGAIALAMALAAPQRVLSLTLVAPGGIGPQVNGALLRAYARAADPAALRAAHEAMAAPGHRAPDRLVAALVKARAEPGQAEALAALAEVVSRNDGRGVIDTARLAGFAMPVTVLWGTADEVLAFAQSAALPPGFRLRRIEGAGHMLPEEAPQAVLAAIRDNLGGKAG